MVNRARWPSQYRALITSKSCYPIYSSAVAVCNSVLVELVSRGLRHSLSGWKAAQRILHREAKRAGLDSTIVDVWPKRWMEGQESGAVGVTNFKPFSNGNPLFTHEIPKENIGTARDGAGINETRFGHGHYRYSCVLLSTCRTGRLWMTCLLQVW